MPPRGRTSVPFFYFSRCVLAPYAMIDWRRYPIRDKNRSLAFINVVTRDSSHIIVNSFVTPASGWNLPYGGPEIKGGRGGCCEICKVANTMWIPFRTPQNVPDSTTAIEISRILSLMTRHRGAWERDLNQPWVVYLSSSFQRLCSRGTFRP